MYGLVTVWTSMDDEPYWVTLLKYESHDMRHTGFRRLMVVNRTPGFWGVTLINPGFMPFAPGALNGAISNKASFISSTETGLLNIFACSS